MRNLVVRIAFAVIAIPAAVLIIYEGGWILAVALSLLGVLGTRELFVLARRQGVMALDLLGYIAAAAIPIGLASSFAFTWPYALSAWLLLVMMAALALRAPGDKPLTAVSLTVFAPLYASWLPAFLLTLRGGAGVTRWGGTWLALLPLVATWVCDTAAMGAGAAVGGPKLAPVVSPRKTWAGAVGGLVGGVAATLVIGLWVLPGLGVTLAAWQLAVIGVAIGLLAQVGDVAESLFKREAGVKDSSGLIPGHGGVLDRLDSLYFALPATAGLLWVFGVL